MKKMSFFSSFFAMGSGVLISDQLDFYIRKNKRSPQYNSKVAYCHHMGKPIILVFT